MSNVTRFGAIGDGVADDTEAIQHAVTQGDGVLHFPPGTYRITEPIEIKLAERGPLGIDGTGGTAHNFRFSTTLGEALAAALVPASLYTRMPLTGRAVATALTWVPTVVAALLAISFDKRYLRVTRLPRPGALPSALAEALRHVEVPPPGEVWPL